MKMQEVILREMSGEIKEVRVAMLLGHASAQPPPLA